MAALSSHPALVVRAARPGEGRQIAALWRELWDAHDGWGGYEATKDDRAYTRLAARLDEDARIRAGYPVLGRHVHLVAAEDDEVVGQVEGWLERQGTDGATPLSCEVRSLIVTKKARGRGLGDALLGALTTYAREFAGGHAVVLAAEVLEANPARAFYEHLDFHPVSFSVALATDRRIAVARPRAVARTATPEDAVAIALLETVLATRRRRAKDARFDRPRALDASVASAIAAHLGARRTSPADPLELVVDDGGVVRANACFLTSWLDYPFAPARRALLGRTVLDPASDAAPLLAPLLAHACRLSASQEAPLLEITDLDGPGEPLYEASLRLGAKPWSRIMLRHPDLAHGS